jgi:hypothetical protein
MEGISEEIFVSRNLASLIVKFLMEFLLPVAAGNDVFRKDK